MPAIHLHGYSSFAASVCGRAWRDMAATSEIAMEISPSGGDRLNEQANAPRQAPPLYNPESNSQSNWQSSPQSSGAQPRDSYAMTAPSRARTHAATLRTARRKQPDLAQRLTTGLGWLSIGLGAAQLLAPRKLDRATGAGASDALWRAIGVRELASGIGILSRPHPAPWLWSRVAGDAIDLALLGAAVGQAGTRPRARRTGAALAMVAAIAALDVFAGIKQRSRRQAAPHGRPQEAADEVDIEKSITINRSPDECYRFWRDFRNFPRFMKHLESVEPLSDTRSRWVAKGPAGTSFAWEADMTVDRPGELLAWHSVSGSDIRNAGTVHFERAPGGRGTVVRIDLQYKPPLGKAGSAIAKLFGEEPSLQVDQDLRRFKQLIETGEIATTIGQPSGPRSLITRLFIRQGEPG